MLVPFLLTLVAQAACNPTIWYGAAVVVPLVLAAAHHTGDTVTLTQASSAAVTLEYSHSYADEYPAAVRAAEAQCQRYGKHARAQSAPVKLDIDRSAITFDCVRSN